MAGKIPSAFIDELVARVDIVDVIDRRVPLARKGREFLACCPFHEEKTPSFTVSPQKQFYHCFGCGAHGTVIGFLMNYANLGFVEAIEELADGVGMDVPKQTSAKPPPPGEGLDDLFAVVARAGAWFQHQLRHHAGAKKAAAYLKSRGLDGKAAAEFSIGFAPDGWSGLADELGTNSQIRNQLLKAGLINKKEGSDPTRFYDRFRGRIIFPIEDHRGRTVGFGGRVIGDGEPKYLNSPETPLFHKGSALYGLHRARRAIGSENKSIVVEGYMDVIGLVQFGVSNAVATLGTATTRTHLQRLFRLAPEIVFCFDGDRAGYAAAWKAMQISLPELQDGRQVGFLFLDRGEDPDTTVRAEGKAGFMEKVDNAVSLPDFLFDSLIARVDMNRVDGKARLVHMVKPFLAQLPDGALKEMMYLKLSSLSGLSDAQLARSHPPAPRDAPGMRRKTDTDEPGQISPVALAVSLLLQNPALARAVTNLEELEQLRIEGSDVLVKMIRQANANPEQTTARLLESFREASVHGYLEKLAVRPNLIDEEALPMQFTDTLGRLLEDQKDHRRMELLETARRRKLDGGEKKELAELLRARVKIT